ncbi:arsenate reductase ArsC [Pigmentiphaga aceris]|uniref:Arsenate reductase ArsC n=1 Tax=Pigmentiphaga aceris TaxID=1940612 RepID=A0A5C0B0U5_9BURK|nr:arsenate reductase ArsC [Pigmentiphaga aceris]QEI06730.1 arsenate reductase ArsC [Pigmentiphaga aceris]
MTSAYNVLFICTANSARSIMAEGLLNSLGGGRFQAFSAGSFPKGSVHPLALATLEQMGLPTDGYRSKSWEEFAEPGAPELDFIFTVCDDAAGEVCPVWPGEPISAHWEVLDPVRVDSSEAAQSKAFLEAAVVLKRRIELLVSLPEAHLDAISIHQHLHDIGKQ